MKRSYVVMALVAVIAYGIPALCQTNVIGPPLKLEFGMSYSETKSSLKAKDIKLDKPKQEKKYKLPKGFEVAGVGKYKVLDHKTDKNLACFNGDGELCAFQINFRWSGSNAKSDGMKFWTEELKKALIGKYSGEGFKQHNDPDQDGNFPELAFRDEVGNEVAAYFQTAKGLLGEVFFISLYYSNEEILRETRAQQKSTDDI